MLLIALSVEALSFLFAGLAWGLYVPAEHEQQRRNLKNKISTESAPKSEHFAYDNSIICSDDSQQCANE